MKDIVVALDFSTPNEALEFVDKLSPDACRLKVGKELFTQAGPELVRALIKRDFDVFLDLKFHDIPNTVAQAVKAAADLGVWMVNVHASGGERMMRAARSALMEYGDDAPLLIAVTVLTSMSEEELNATGIQRPLLEHVLQLAHTAQNAGMDGVVCSAQEVPLLRGELGANFALVTPGIRPAGSALDDQTRVMTPADAIAAGSTYLVMGRPIRHAPDPMALLSEINQQISRP